MEQMFRKILFFLSFNKEKKNFEVFVASNRLLPRLNTVLKYCKSIRVVLAS